MSISVAKAEPDISLLALEATLTAMKGTGWTIESLRAIYNLIVALPPGLTAADVWTFAARRLTNLSDIRAGYIDNINNAQLLNVPDLSTLSALRIGYLDNINNAQLLNISAAILARIDVAISSRLATASYTAERGTDNALLAASFPDSASYTAAKAAFLDAKISEVIQQIALTGHPAGSIGKKLFDYLTGDAYVRLGAPALASVSADIAAIKALSNNLDVLLSTRQATLTRPLGLYPSDVNQLTNATERTTISATYVKLKEIVMGCSAMIRTSFDLNSSLDSAKGQVYKNGVAVGTERTNNTAVYITFTEDLVFTAGDLYQIYGKNIGGQTTKVRNQLVNGSEGVGVATAGY